MRALSSRQSARPRGPGRRRPRRHGVARPAAALRGVRAARAWRDRGRAPPGPTAGLTAGRRIRTYGNPRVIFRQSREAAGQQRSARRRGGLPSGNRAGRANTGAATGACRIDSLPSGRCTASSRTSCGMAGAESRYRAVTSIVRSEGTLAVDVPNASATSIARSDRPARLALWNALATRIYVCAVLSGQAIRHVRGTT
jgi:hypothetical protein